MKVITCPVIFFVACVIIGVTGKDEDDELLSVAVLYRHGDRTIIHTFPNDPYNNDSYWPEGYGQLTNEGKQRHYEYGHWLRQRYADFLPSSYNKKDIHIISTDVDRTLMSAASNLAGLYPPEDDQIWNGSLLWQPIPVHIAPEATLNELDVCPKYDLKYAELMLSDHFREIDEANKDIYEYLSNNTGEPIITLAQTSRLRDVLFIETNRNLPLPDWTSEVYPEKLNELAGEVFASLAYTEELARLAIGPLLQDILDYFHKVVDGTDPIEKMKVYSGHDSIVAGVLSGLDDFDPQCPPYTSSVLFELRQKNNQSIINVIYRIDADHLVPISIRGCDVDCPLEEAKQRLENVTVNSVEWYAECWLPIDEERSIPYEIFPKWS